MCCGKQKYQGASGNDDTPFNEHTVDGSEIRRSPVEVGSLSHHLQGFSTIPSGCLGFLPSIVAIFDLKRGTMEI